MKKNSFLCSLLFVFIVSLLSTTAYSQNKVVVIPMAGQDAPPVPQNILPVAYGVVSSIGEFVSGVGVESSTQSQTGVYLITLTQAVDSAIIVGTSFNSSPGTEIVTANNAGNGIGVSNQIEINISDQAGIAVNSGFYFMVFGTVAPATASVVANQKAGSSESIDIDSN